MSSTAWATPGLGFDSQGKHIKIKHIPLMHLKPFWIKWYTKWKWKPILFCFRLSIQQYPSSTLALLTSMCFVNCTTGLCHFCINIWHTCTIYQSDICNVFFSQMFMEEVIPAFQSCQNPQNTQHCKFDADQQHAILRI